MYGSEMFGPKLSSSSVLEAVVCMTIATAALRSGHDSPDHSDSRTANEQLFEPASFYYRRAAFRSRCTRSRYGNDSRDHSRSSGWSD